MAILKELYKRILILKYKIKSIMTKNPISVEQNTLAADLKYNE